MIRALTTGQLYGDPQTRTSQSGKAYTTAKLRADGKDGATVWVSLVAFGELAERLAALKANNAIAVSGKLEASAYLNKQGEPAAGLSVVIDELATLKARPKPESESRPRGFHRSHPGPMPEPPQPQRLESDDIPFDDALPF